MTWPPTTRTTGRGTLVGDSGALLSTPKPKPRGPKQEDVSLGWLGSLRSSLQPRPPPQRRGVGTDAPPSPSTAAPVPPPRRSVGINNACAASATIGCPNSPAAPPGSPQVQLQASSTAPLGSPPPLAALATAFIGAPLHLLIKPATASCGTPPPPPATSSRGSSPRPPTTKQPTLARGAPPPPPPTKPPKGIRGAPPPPPIKPPTRTRGARPPPTKSLTGTRGAPPPPAEPPTGTPAPRPLQTNKAVMTSGTPPLPPHLASFGQRIIEVLFNLNYAHLGYAGAVLMGVYAGLKDLLSDWNAILKVFYVLLLILGAFSLGSGLMAATSIAPTGYTHRVSSVCSRICTCLATFVFVIALACHMGSYGYIAGIVLGVVGVSYIVSVWIMGDPAAYGAYTTVKTSIEYLWQRYKWSGQSGPILP